MSKQPVAPERRVRGLMDDGERLLGVLVTDETDQGWYAIVVRDWEHPNAPECGTLSERYAYLTKGDGNDGWVDGSGDSGASAINRRDRHDRDGRLAGALAKLYAHAADVQRQQTTETIVGSIVEEE